MALTKDKGKITKYGGGVLKLREVGDDGTVVSGSTVYDLGYIQETRLSDETGEESVKDETGSIVQSHEGDRGIKFTGVLMQTDKELIDFLKENVRGKYFQVYYKANNNVNGQVQEIFFAIVKVKPMIDLASNTRRLPFEMTALKNEGAITISDASTAYGSTASTATIPAGQYYVVTETSIP